MRISRARLFSSIATNRSKYFTKKAGCLSRIVHLAFCGCRVENHGSKSIFNIFFYKRGENQKFWRKDGRKGEGLAINFENWRIYREFIRFVSQSSWERRFHSADPLERFSRIDSYILRLEYPSYSGSNSSLTPCSNR